MPSQLLKLTLLLAGIICPSASLPIGGSENDFRPDTWENIPTSTDTIQWSRCPNSYDEDPSMRCARLKVPLDYEDPKAGTTTIAFMKYLAEHATATTQDILYNPGGPGGSGIGYLLMKKHQLRKALGMSHNIVAFDPRGIGHSGPNTDCFNGDDLAAYQFASTTYPEVISREKALNASFTNSNTWGNLCKTNLDTSAHYLGTPAVAQDLLTYVERDAATKQMDPEEAKVNFFGVSYGTGK
jgi:pimeloyl-ACP methyl ester carboxylesterase